MKNVGTILIQVQLPKDDVKAKRKLAELFLRMTDSKVMKDIKLHASPLSICHDAVSS